MMEDVLALVAVHESERRARDGRGDAELAGEALHERCLPDTELPDEEDEVASTRKRRDDTCPRTSCPRLPHCGRPASSCGEHELGPDEVGPHLRERLRSAPDRRRGVQGRHEHGVTEGVAAAAELRDALGRLEQQLCRRSVRV